MADKYLIVSDLHLCDVEDHLDGWKWYKSSRYVFDEEFASLLDEFASSAATTDSLALILNGDIIDFDLVTAIPEDPPWPVSRSERHRGLDATEEKSVWKLERVLADHPRFLAALAGFCGKGHRIVYVRGNHDPELHFRSVREALTAAIRRMGAESDVAVPDDAIQYEPWFYFVPGRLYVEHGHQYDYYSSFRSILSPIVIDESRNILALPMGNLSNRYVMSNMGYFNPHQGDFILNAFSYAYHWLKHYAFSRRGIALNWFFGSLVVMRKLLRQKRLILGRPPDKDALLEHQAARFRIPLETVKALDALGRPPITDRFYRIVREFWMDRVIMAGIMVGGTVALALVPIPLWIKLMVPLSCFPLFYFLYEELARSETIFTIEKEFPKYARRISDLVSTRLVAFGHTHVPRLIPLRQGVSFVDTGTWAPVFRADDNTKLAPGYRTYLLVSFDDRRGVDVKLDSWSTGRAQAGAETTGVK